MVLSADIWFLPIEFIQRYYSWGVSKQIQTWLLNLDSFYLLKIDRLLGAEEVAQWVKCSLCMHET